VLVRIPYIDYLLEDPCSLQARVISVLEDNLPRTVEKLTRDINFDPGKGYVTRAEVATVTTALAGRDYLQVQTKPVRFWRIWRRGPSRDYCLFTVHSALLPDRVEPLPPTPYH
jgi:hypothetical protein